MKHGLTLVELAQKVQAQSQDRADYVADTSMMAARGSEAETQSLLIGDDYEFKPTPHAHGQIAAHTGIPKRYYDRMLAEQPGHLSQDVPR